jgi:hypothetical protein
MTPAVAFLIAEGVKLLFQHLSSTGQLNTLTPEQADAMVAKLAASLPDILPSPEELEGSSTPPIGQ